MLDLRPVSEGFAAAPQIVADDLAEVKRLGYRLVVSNRPDGEEPGQPAAADFAEAAAAQGLAFRHIPVAGGFSHDQVADMAALLSEAEGPVLAFCRSGTRSTLLWSLAQASRGAEPEAIAAAAAAAGYDIAPVRAAVEQLAANARP